MREETGRNWKIPEDSVQAMAAELKARKKCGKEKSQKLLPCAVGNTSYMEIARDCYYVDKTLLIRALIDDHSAVTLFTRPRRFGKTLAINMLRIFFEKTDEDTSVYFRDKKIWKCGKRYRSLQGTYPVVYNPWSVTNYFNNNCQPRAYWANTSNNEIIQEMMRGLTPEIAEELLSLMQGDTVQASLNMEVIYPRISDGPDTIFSFLLIAGYLKPVHEAVETEFGTFVELQLPNMEIRRVYNTEILSWLRGSMEGNAMAEIEKSLYLNDGDRLKTALQKYMISCISSFDGAAEGFYHGMVLGLVASMSSRYYIRSNRESGNGRFALQMEPKTRNLPGIIMEFKAAKAAEKDQLSELAADGLKQISDRHYDTDMQERGITDIAKYGIAFAGKEVEVKM
ncbi:MAG: AAA family ATPase [Lachnospiraceae bacterium]|nr:AAA family ATPase [Lachnospiraceae bacterium]